MELFQLYKCTCFCAGLNTVSSLSNPGALPYKNDGCACGTLPWVPEGFFPSVVRGEAAPGQRGPNRGGQKVTFVSDLYQTVRTSYFIVGVKRMDLWSHGSVTAYLSL